MTRSKTIVCIVVFALATLLPLFPVWALTPPLTPRTPIKIATSSGNVILIKPLPIKRLPNLALIKGVMFTDKLVSIGTDALTVGTKTVNLTTETKLLRRFGGKAELSEFAIGDQLQIIGKTTATASATVEAKVVRDLSIQKRFGVFFGRVLSLKPETGEFTIQSLNRGQLSAAPDTKTIYVNRKQITIKFSDLAIGHTVRVKGVWNRETNTLAEVTQVKDYSLPTIPAQKIGTPSSSLLTP